MDETVYSDDGRDAVSVYGLLSAAAHASAVYQAFRRLRDPGGLGGRRVHADGCGLSPDGRGLVDRYGRRAFTFGVLSSLFFRCISTIGSAAFCFCLHCGSCTARAGLFDNLYRYGHYGFNPGLPPRRRHGLVWNGDDGCDGHRPDAGHIYCRWIFLSDPVSCRYRALSDCLHTSLHDQSTLSSQTFGRPDSACREIRSPCHGRHLFLAVAYGELQPSSRCLPSPSGSIREPFSWCTPSLLP